MIEDGVQIEAVAQGRYQERDGIRSVPYRRYVFLTNHVKWMRLQNAAVSRYTDDGLGRHQMTQGLRNNSVNRSVLPVTDFRPTSNRSSSSGR